MNNNVKNNSDKNNDFYNQLKGTINSELAKQINHLVDKISQNCEQRDEPQENTSYDSSILLNKQNNIYCTQDTLLPEIQEDASGLQVPWPAWQHYAKMIVEQCNEYLDENDLVQKYLEGRGINSEIINQYSLGYNKQDLYLEREDWGFQRECLSDGREKKLFIPQGILIPYYNPVGDLYRIRVRRDTVPPGNSRYMLISGSRSNPFEIDNEHSIWVIVESELDAMMINYYAGDIVNVIALGMANIKPIKRLVEKLRYADKILMTINRNKFNKDNIDFWRHFGKIFYYPCINGEDPQEMYRNGINIRSWIQKSVFRKDN